MPSDTRPYLLDVTRLISHSWTGRQSTGIDRVCLAYARHFSPRALAVVQHRGIVRTINSLHSDELFALLLDNSKGFRLKLARFAARALATTIPEDDLIGRIYVNVSHTDFDLHGHFDWVARSGVRPFYFIHDLIPIRHPNYSRPHAVVRHLGRVKSALRRAEGLIVSSQTVSDDLGEFAREHGHPVPPVLVAPIAGEPLAMQQGEVGLPDTPYFLCLGTIEPRKNHALLFEVWRDLVARQGENAPRLMIVGQTGPLTGATLDPLKSDPALARHVELRSGCTDAELAGLMSSAIALLMPSLAEGFGLPVVEALALGTPVVASDIAIFREVSQGAAQQIDPADRAGWAACIEKLSGSKERTNHPFDPPLWPDHFKRVEAWIASDRLKSAAACESSLAA